MEGDVFPQVEGVGQAVFRNIPVFGNTGDDGAGFIVEHQALEHIVHDGLGVGGGGLPGV